MPDTKTRRDAYVILKVDQPRRIDLMYKDVMVYICVISHQDIMQVENGRGTRIDLMGEVIEELFNGRDDFGFGEMQLQSNTETAVNVTHPCREISFLVKDFNSDACNEE